MGEKVNVGKTFTGYCPYCKKQREGVKCDHGIGGYEFWGQKCTQHDYVVECVECDSPLDDPYPVWESSLDGA